MNLFGGRRTTLLAALALIYVVVVLGVAAYRAREDQSSTSDFDDFWLTARHFLDTGEVVETYGVHNYLPFFVIYCLPLAWLPMKAASLMFNVVGLLGLAAGLVLVDRGLEREVPPGRAPPARWMRLAGPLAQTVIYITGCLVMGQVAVQTLAMLMLAWYFFERRREGVSAFWLALAISSKVYPAVLVAWLVLKRRLRCLTALSLWLILMNAVLPAVVFGASRAWAMHVDYWQRSIVGQSAVTLARIESDKMSYTNQSLALVDRRWTRRTDSGVNGPDGQPRFINAVDWGDKLYPLWPYSKEGDLLGGVRLTRGQWIVVMCNMLLVLTACWAARHSARQLSMAQMRYEFAAFVLLGLLLSPIAWSFYYTLCLFPLLLLTWHVLTCWKGGRPAVTATFVSAVWWAGTAAMASPLLRMCGYHLAATVLLFAAMLVLSKSYRGAAQCIPSVMLSEAKHLNRPRQ